MIVRVLVFALVVGSGACVRSALVDCEDGRSCPIGLVCDDAHQACVAPAQLEACRDRPDETPCDAITGGLCFEGVCVASGCGNGWVETTRGERCDDGNNEDGDGCSADCGTDERCGNGIVDLGEACDDGNFLSHDGCSSACGREVPTWRLEGGAFAPIIYSAVAYDAARDHVVVFGGGATQPTLSRATGLLWPDQTSTVQGAQGPSRRHHHAMVFDAARSEVVLFGGNLDHPVDNFASDTWTWNGARWTRRQLALHPPANAEHAMAYDAARREVVVFTNRFNADGETWIWDGSAWRQATTAGPGGWRPSASMAYDPARGEVVLFGGGTDETWIWNGTSWTERSGAGARPAVRSGAAMAWDGTRLVLVGGVGTGGSGISDGITWGWNGTTWTALPVGTIAPPSGWCTGTSDGRRGRVIVVAAAGIWEWDGASWSMPVDRTVTPEVAQVAKGMAFDARTGEAVLVRGNASTPNRTFLWNGRWRDALTPTPAVSSLGLAFDALRDQLALVGGTGTTTVWSTWRDDAWAPTIDLAMPYGHGRLHGVHPSGDVVTYGGTDFTGPEPVNLGDHWRLDPSSSTVTELMPDPSPGPLAQAGIATDTARGEVVVFGGARTAGGFSNAIWEWNGSRWRQASPVPAPAPRYLPNAAYDPGLRRTIVFGGSSLVSIGGITTIGMYFNDTWLWDGDGWTELVVVNPPTLVTAAMTYDAIRQRTVLVGRPAMGGGTATWTFAYDSGDVDEACGWGRDIDGDGLIGCADPDCWGRCTPACAPGQMCTRARCGDGACDAALEDPRLCPTDCPLVDVRCGDLFCDPGETVASCPGDCS